MLKDRKEKKKTEKKNFTKRLVLYLNTHPMHFPQTNTMMPHYGTDT